MAAPSTLLITTFLEAKYLPFLTLLTNIRSLRIWAKDLLQWTLKRVVCWVITFLGRCTAGIPGLFNSVEKWKLRFVGIDNVRVQALSIPQLKHVTIFTTLANGSQLETLFFAHRYNKQSSKQSLTTK